MIGCDNESCPIVWFHLKCAGVKTIPDNEWYCKRCAKQFYKNLYKENDDELVELDALFLSLILIGPYNLFISYILTRELHKLKVHSMKSENLGHSMSFFLFIII